MKKLSLLTFLVLALFACTTGESSRSERDIQAETDIRAIETGLIKAITVKGDSVVGHSITERMEFHKVPGVSIAVVKDGELLWAKAYGMANTLDSTEVTTRTLFQAGSISKPVAALAALKLHEEGKLDLDAPVNTYLDAWKLEENEYTRQSDVTVRRLLTHTAGVTVHGFPGYTRSDTFPSDREVLDGEGNTARIFVDTPPDSRWRYSGGGYTIMEQVVEEISGKAFDQYLDQDILRPLQMMNSTYMQPLPEEYHSMASAAYDGSGEIIEGLWHNYPEQAAAGLWTTPTDLATYYTQIFRILEGDSTSLLSGETVGLMLTKHKNDWGLGPALEGKGDSLRFGHGGKNAGFTNNMTGFAHLGDAIIVMTNADNGGALIGEVLRAASLYYGWDIAAPEEVELAAPGEVELGPIAGRYKYAGQVPGIGDYFMELIIENGKLIAFDPNDGSRLTMHPMDSTRFIDLESGERMVLTGKADSMGFNWNGRYKFNKLQD